MTKYNRIYSFRRVLQNQPEFTLVPCVKDGVAGMYDEVSGIFCASRSGTPFVAGPGVSAANGGGGWGVSAQMRKTLTQTLLVAFCAILLAKCVKEVA